MFPSQRQNQVWFLWPEAVSFLDSPTTLCCRYVVWVGCDLFRPVSCVCCVRLRRQPASWDGRTTGRLTVTPSESRPGFWMILLERPLMCPGQLSWGISHILASLALYSSGSWLGLCSVSQRSSSSVQVQSLYLFIGPLKNILPELVSPV